MEVRCAPSAFTDAGSGRIVIHGAWPEAPERHRTSNQKCSFSQLRESRVQRAFVKAPAAPSPGPWAESRVFLIRTNLNDLGGLQAYYL
jgi:hypothetical protein